MTMNIDKYPIIQTDTPLPANTSESAKNSYCVQCPSLNRSAGYPVCLNTIKAYRENRLDSTSFVDCQRAITHEQCIASALQAAEQTAGKALYYRERIPLAAKVTDPDNVSERKPTSPEVMASQSYKNGWNQVNGKKAKDYPSPPPKQKTKVETKKESSLEEGQMDLGRMVTDAIASEPESSSTAEQTPSNNVVPIVKPPATKNLKPNKGESMIDFVRRKQKLQQEESAI